MKSINLAGAYTAKRLCFTNIADLARLHTSVYGKIPLPGFFEQKYDTAYTGISHIGYIAYNEQQLPIAFYGVIPCFLQCDDESILSAQSADTMTHPDHRNKGLFVKLANITFDLCIALDIKLLFGFPNQNSLPGFINKLGWQLAGQMDCFVIPVKTLPLEKLVAKLGMLKKAYSRYTNLMLAKYISGQPVIPASVLGDGYDGLALSEGYLQNKKYSNTYVISIGNGICWIKINNGLLIGDMQVTSDEFSPAIRQLQNIAAKLGLRQIQFHTSKGTLLHQLFAARYKPIESFPVIFKQLGAGIATDKIKFTLADIDIF